MLTISGRAVGARRPLFADFSVPPPEEMEPGGGRTLRDVIEGVVLHQIRLFRDRQEAQRLDRVLSPARISAGAARGKVDPAGKDHQQEVDEEAAVGAALQGFEDGLYLVIIDDVERKSLDEQVFLRPDSRMVFVRLAFLAGA